MIFRLIFTFIRILFLLIHFLVENRGTNNLVGSDPNTNSSPPEHVEMLSPTRVAAKPGETAAHDLASSWCSAYRSSDPGRLAALETREMEIVDRFGDWHDLLGLNAREQFWKEGFEITSRKDFRPECSVLHVRLIGLTAAIAQVKVSYNGGIGLKDGDRIPPFSEIHTLVLVKVEGTWLISGQEIVQQNS
jgi:hypothetical protein